MNSISNGMVEIVFDSQKKKLRAKMVNSYHWVRFPNNLRVKGAVYQVEELRRSGSSYIAVGKITAVGAK